MSKSLSKLIFLLGAVLTAVITGSCCGTIINELTEKKEWREKIGTCRIDANDTTLDLFVGDKRELLLRYLCSSAEWRVTRFGETPAIKGTLVAIKRARGNPENFSPMSGDEAGEDGKTEEGCWYTTLHGYVADFNADTLLQSRVMIRLEHYKPRSEDGWIRNNWYDKGVIGDAAVELNVYKPDYEQPGFESYLVLEGAEGEKGEGVWVEIFEQSKSKWRKFTQKTIDEIDAELRWLLEKGFSPALLPKGSTKISDKSLIFVGDGMQPGIYMASGYVNPGKPGWTYFKVYNTETGAEVMYEMEQKRTIEYVGWSSDLKEKFFFNCEVWCKEGDWEQEYPARFELWFVPEDGSPERLLETAERRIYGWER